MDWAETIFGGDPMDDAMGLLRNSKPSAGRDDDSEVPPSTTRVTQYVNECVLLSLTTRDELTRRWLERLERLRSLIETAESGSSKQLEDMENASRVGHRGTEKLVSQKVKKLAIKGANLASDVAAEGVREFGAELLAAQGRLGINANWLREYTGLIATEVRDRVSEARMFRAVPLQPWGQDPITRKAMHVCEEMIAERSNAGDRWICAVEDPAIAERTWSTIVQAWEVYKADENIPLAPQQRIPESVLRTLIARQNCVEPRDVTWEQICNAGGRLCRHYGPVLLIPRNLETHEPIRGPEGSETAQFWKEREAEFRKHDTPENELVADWFSLYDSWSFRTRLGRSPAPGLEQVFKSLAREAAKGLVYVGDNELWIVWLNALRRAIDQSTGRRIYSGISSTGSWKVRDSASNQIFKSGDTIPGGGVWQFVASDQAVTGAERLMYWETTTETIEQLFTASANFCLQLRSLVTSPQGAAEKMAEPVGKFEDMTCTSSTDHSSRPSPNSASIDELVSFRANLLNEYKRSTGNPSNSKIYQARTSGIHKPQFYEWLRGELSAGSETTVNFERFLREKKPPIPRPRPTKR